MVLEGTAKVSISLEKERNNSMDYIQVFRNSEFGSVRTIEENGIILFCAKILQSNLGTAIRETRFRGIARGS